MSDQLKVEPAGRVATARYVATLTAELSVMARRSGLDALGYILEMARLEAEGEAKNARTNGGS